VSLLMLAVVALFPIVLLALLLITSGMERRVVGDSTSGRAPGSGRPPGTGASRPGVSAARPGGRAVDGACHRRQPRTPPCQPASGRRARPAT
jgi:hypothetical protein